MSRINWLAAVIDGVIDGSQPAVVSVLTAPESGMGNVASIAQSQRHPTAPPHSLPPPFVLSSSRPLAHCHGSSAQARLLAECCYTNILRISPIRCDRQKWTFHVLYQGRRSVSRFETEKAEQRIDRGRQPMAECCGGGQRGGQGGPCVPERPSDQLVIHSFDSTIRASLHRGSGKQAHRGAAITRGNVVGLRFIFPVHRRISLPVLVPPATGSQGESQVVRSLLESYPKAIDKLKPRL